MYSTFKGAFSFKKSQNILLLRHNEVLLLRIYKTLNDKLVKIRAVILEQLI